MQDTWSIGELAARAGLSVKTVRYYSDVGLLPLAGRSQGGHRRYLPEALEQLRFIRHLRALNLPIESIIKVADGELPLDDLLAEQLSDTRTRLGELRWREAVLRALDDCPGAKRLRRLRLLARVHSLPQAAADISRAWGHIVPASVPRRLTEAITAQSIPEPPSAPTPETVLAYAELHALVTEPQFLLYWAAPYVDDKASLYAELLDASEQATPIVAAGLPPQRCSALSTFASACARGRGTEDTPAYRASIAAEFRTTVPVFRKYWQHLSVVTASSEPTLGASHSWLVEALITESLTAADGD
ncbi:MerR family transcriptional regulator [Streptomyces sp. NPDC050617]|uniref:MerR family transcriptional regulator n=1 Tax=Streptomyces sp. NPDC050617 TaxID=3154628 RepID=UPI003440DE29